MSGCAKSDLLKRQITREEHDTLMEDALKEKYKKHLAEGKQHKGLCVICQEASNAHFLVTGSRILPVTVVTCLPQNLFFPKS